MEFLTVDLSMNKFEPVEITFFTLNFTKRRNKLICSCISHVIVCHSVVISQCSTSFLAIADLVFVRQV